MTAEAQIRSIDKLDEKLSGFHILKSSEVDILADGSLDYPDELLRGLNYTVCSIHSRFGLDREGQIERLLRPMDNRYFNILGHSTGRLLLQRPGYEIDLERVIVHARQNGCSFEINSSPDRLDLSADNARIAVAAGIMIAISTDAHGTRDLSDPLRPLPSTPRRAGKNCRSKLPSIEKVAAVVPRLATDRRCLRPSIFTKRPLVWRPSALARRAPCVHPCPD